jgi:hypothetical protein
MEGNSYFVVKRRDAAKLLLAMVVRESRRIWVEEVKVWMRERRCTIDERARPSPSPNSEPRGAIMKR